MTTVPNFGSILIVEDESPLRRALVDKFIREGFTVFEAKDGDTGFAVALVEKPQVILLDMMMPKVDGITMLHQLRSAGDWGKRVPVLLLTNISSDDKRMLREVAEDGAAHYLVKSDWSISKLVQRAKDAITEG